MDQSTDLEHLESLADRIVLANSWEELLGRVSKTT
jgi:hypothetical protein